MYFIAHYRGLHYFVGSSRSYRSALKATMYTWPSYIVLIAQPYLNAKVCTCSSYTNMRTAFKHQQNTYFCCFASISIFPFTPAIMAFLCILVRLAILYFCWWTSMDIVVVFTQQFGFTCNISITMTQTCNVCLPETKESANCNLFVFRQ